MATEASVPGVYPAGGQHVGTAEGCPREPDRERVGGFVSGGVSCPWPQGGNGAQVGKSDTSVAPLSLRQGSDDK